jgi:DNA repair exonuclease SbcCD nuclease subunit
MVKKVIHIADVHIRAYKMHKEYKEILQIFLDQIIELSNEYEDGELRIVIAGDLVHQKITISNELMLMGTWFLRECAKVAPTIIIAGNHDLLENNKNRLDSITPMVELLDSDRIQYLKDSKCYEDDNIVWCCYSIFEENKPPNIKSARKKIGDDKTYVGLYHAPIMGASTDIGYEFDHGGTLEQFKDCDIVMLGDIHKRQSFKYGDIPIAYPSSIIQQNFGESVSDHGYLIWDIDSKTFEERNIDTNYGFYQFKITSLDDLENEAEILTNK